MMTRVKTMAINIKWLNFPGEYLVTKKDKMEIKIKDFDEFCDKDKEILQEIKFKQDKIESVVSSIVIYFATVLIVFAFILSFME